MNSRPIHKNLDTAFVNLSALVKYLRRRQFVGVVSVQLNGYQAEIQIKPDNQLGVREHDQISGRVSDGEEAFQRLLIRAREPGGTINVVQHIAARTPVVAKKTASKANNPAPKQMPKEEILQAEIIDTPVPKPKAVPLRADAKIHKNGNGNSNGNGNKSKPIEKLQRPVSVSNDETTKRQPSLPDFPFLLTNKVEQKAKKNKLATNDWQILLKLSVELLRVVDRSLADHGLDFSAAFKQARTDIASDYPFMNPSAEIFNYQDGRLTMTTQINESFFVGSIAEALKRIFERLGQNPNLEIAYRDTSQMMISLINKRKSHYDRFGLTPPLNKILGI